MKTAMVIRRVPSSEVRRLLPLYKEHNRDQEWIFENMEVLLQKYPELHIAVKNEKIVYSGNTIDELIMLIEADGLEPENFVIEFITPKSTSFLL